MAICNACGKPKSDDRFKACAKCRAGWRLDEGLSYQRRIVSIEQHTAALSAANLRGRREGLDVAAEVCCKWAE
jgi:hypothetical protein